MSTFKRDLAALDRASHDLSEPVAFDEVLQLGRDAVRWGKAQRAAAKQDMALARKQGEIMVAQTRVGNVFLSYEKGRYELVKQATHEQASRGSPASVLASGAARDILPTLASLYVVEGA